MALPGTSPLLRVPRTRRWLAKWVSSRSHPWLDQSLKARSQYTYLENQVLKAFRSSETRSWWFSSSLRVESGSTATCKLRNQLLYLFRSPKPFNSRCLRHTQQEEQPWRTMDCKGKPVIWPRKVFLRQLLSPNEPWTKSGLLRWQNLAVSLTC